MNNFGKNGAAAFDRTRSLLLLMGLACLGLFSYALGIIIATDGPELFLFGTAISSMVVVLLPMVVSRRYFIFEPLTFVALSVLLGITLKTFYVVVGYGINPVVTERLMDYMTVPEMQYGSFVLLTGLITFVLGYSVNLRPMPVMRRLRNYGFARDKLVIVGSIFIAISLISFVFLIIGTGFSFSGVADLSQKRFQSNGVTSADRLGDLNYYFYRIALISKAPMYVFFYLLIRHKLRWTSIYGLLFWISCTINILVPFFVSNKAGILLPITDLIVISYLISGRLNYKKIAAVIVAALAIISIIATFRGGAAVSDFTLADKFFGGRYFIGITKSAHIINAFPEYLNYFNGTTFVGWMNLFLPESMKFDNSAFTGLGFYLGYHVFNQPFSGVPPGIVPEFYMNFGYWGVFCGMFIIGVLLKWLHNNFYAHIISVAAIVIYAIIVVRMPTFLFNNGFTIAFLKSAADIIIVALFLFIIRSRKRSAIK